eukprot:gnl/MRDRNA2_/MRDRNA2_29683_c0_seq1.p1 gnl/MRDRNA2_/MRDRNA2_29683_c0~~gnl/MRDRNA2_/MRDRNA2_29683_c0_seq1.p1  ORF type:complete len:441 (-),score=64.86 gnl/MRDRNA2_/MRDRNA2_29683_c0_seq1:245-1543(-)
MAADSSEDVAKGKLHVPERSGAPQLPDSRSRRCSYIKLPVVLGLFGWSGYLALLMQVWYPPDANKEILCQAAKAVEGHIGELHAGDIASASPVQIPAEHNGSSVRIQNASVNHCALCQAQEQQPVESSDSGANQPGKSTAEATNNVVQNVYVESKVDKVCVLQAARVRAALSQLEAQKLKYAQSHKTVPASQESFGGSQSFEYSWHVRQGGTLRGNDALFLGQTDQLFRNWGIHPEDYSDNKVIVDMGAGSRLRTRGFFTQGTPRIVAIEPLAQQWVDYKLLNPGKLTWCDLEQAHRVFATPAEIPACEFAHKADLVVSVNVLDHVASPQMFLDAVSMYLKCDGIAIISTDYHPPAQGHPHQLSQKALKMHSEKSGLEAIRSEMLEKKSYGHGDAWTHFWVLNSRIRAKLACPDHVRPVDPTKNTKNAGKRK